MKIKQQLKRGILLGFAFLCFLIGYSQDITIYGEVRPRAEYRDGYGKPIKSGTKGGFFIDQRTRIGAEFSNEWVKMKVTFQDSRTWGDENSDSDKSSVSIYEAYGEVRLLSNLRATLGRQALKYDDRKIFDPSEWSNTGAAFDIMMLKYNLNDDFKADIGFSYSNNSEISQETYYEANMQYRFMEMLWMSKKIGKDFNLSVIGIAMTSQDSITSASNQSTKDRKNYSQFTMGGTLNYQPSSFPFKLLLEGYYQCGKVLYKERLDKLKSYYLVTNASYVLTPWLSIGGGYEYISGDRNPSNNIQRGYIHPFGDGHDFNGTMDYWGDTKERGLQDIYGSLFFEFNKKRSSIESVFHHFRTAVPVVNLDGKGLGYEVDFIIKHAPKEWLSLEAGYSIYMVNENVRILKGVGGEKTKTAQWCYLSLSIKPSFIFHNVGKLKGIPQS